MLLGLSAGFHDSAAALVADGRVVAAVEEERLTRRKHDPSFPQRAADTVLAIAGIEPCDLEAVVFHEKPLGVLDRHLTSRLRNGPSGALGLLFDTPRVVGESLGVVQQIHRWFADRATAVPPILYGDHHTSHAAAAFHPSPFESAAILTVDGVGEWSSSTTGRGVGSRVIVEREIRYPHSIGLLYSAFTSYCGFRVNGGEGELMGLAPFGRPVHADRIREIVDLADDGSIRLDQRYFAYARGRRMTNRRFHDHFGGPPHPLGAPPSQRTADLARSIQVVLEDVLMAMALDLHRATGEDRLCLSGGVALNCVANGRLLRDGPFQDIWIQPAAGDGGSAIGAALWAWHDVLEHPRIADANDGMHGSFLGPAFGRDEISDWLRSEHIAHREVHDDDDRSREVAARLADGAVVGWFAGRMEFGPRALGHRSIIADPRSPDVQGRINAMIKERAAFRPFAPAVLEEHAHEWFDLDGAAPYMNVVTQVAAERLVDAAPSTSGASFEERIAEVRSTIPAVTHVDGSARVQTVDEVRNPEFTRLLRHFERATGCPVLLNTSFNHRDEPIVCTPEDAVRTFRRTGLDVLVLEHCILEAGA